jgi:RHS repeat-associated protein
VPERSRPDRIVRRTFGHRVARIAALVVLAGAACERSAPPAPRAGLHPVEEEARVAVPGGRVTVTGGNLTLARTLLDLETRIGALAIGGLYHSAAGEWRWSFELERLDGRFVDATGAEHDVSTVPDGAIVPGTDWVKLDASRMKTRGGLVHVFDGAGRLAAIHWSSDPYPRVRAVTGMVGAVVRTVALEQCVDAASCEPLYTLEWDARARLVAVEDRAGRRAELGWDAAGRLVATRDAGDVADGLPGDRYVWTGDLVTSLVTSDGERVAYHHVGGRVVAVGPEGPGSPTHVFAYQRLGADANRTTWTAPGGAVTVYDWDDARRVRRRELADLGEVTRLEWDGPRVARLEWPDGRVVERAWSAGHLVSETLPNGNVRRFQWNPDGVHRLSPFSGAPVAVSDDLGPILSVAYDTAGRPVEIRDGAGDLRRLAWDGLELVSLTPPAGLPVEYEGYGEHGFPTRILIGGEVVDEPSYDAVGNRLRGRDPDDPTATSTPGVVERTFDADRNVASLIVADEAGGSVVERTIVVRRRADGRPVRIERPYGGDTEHVYDALGRRVARRERIDGAWQTTVFEWDDAGRLVAEEKPNGMRREVAYDAAGRPLTVSTLRDGVLETVLTSTWQDGRLVAVHDSVRDATETYAYDAAGRVTRTVYARGEATELAYDARDRLTDVTLRLPDGSVLGALGIAYDGADREVSIREGGAAGPELLGRLYEAGRLVETRYGNGLTRTYAYEASGRSWQSSTTTAAEGRWVADTLIQVSPSPGLVLFGFETRTADPLGLVSDPPPDSAPGEVSTIETYWLDSGAGPRPQGMRLRMAHYHLALGTTEYDALGNRLKVEQVPFNSQYGDIRDFVYNGEHNRLLEVRRREDLGADPVTERTYAYDEAGFVTSIDGLPVEWNAQGRVTSVGGLASFEWDAAGRPISRTVLGETTIHWFGGRLEAAAGELPRHLDLGEVRVDLAEGDHRYRHLGPRRNVKFVTDAAGNVVAHHWYGAYGRLATFGPEDDDRGFAGGTHAAGFVVLGARILDPAAGRFLSPDPVETWLDPYAYTWGNPVQLWDPGGLHPDGVPPGPPGEATAARILGAVLGGVGGVLVLTPIPAARIAGSVFIFLGIAAEAVSTALRDDAMRAAASGSASSHVPPIPAAGFATKEICSGGECVTQPRYRPRREPNPGGGFMPGGGGGAGGIDVPSGCSAGTCAFAPLPALLLPWVMCRRARRVAS